MQIRASKFSTIDLVKYPFLKETADYVKQLDFKIEDIANPELAGILQRAQERVKEAISRATISRETRKPEIEILSFPVAIMLVVASGSQFLKKRYALAEAKQAYEDLRQEPTDRLMLIGRELGWELVANKDGKTPYELKLVFKDYLRNTTHLRTAAWRLVNRVLMNGYVYLTRGEVARLLQEEVRRLLERRIDNAAPSNLPKEIVETAQRLASLVTEKVGKDEIEGFPSVVIQEAFPPCVKALYESFASGRHLSHVGRFTLTSFLITVGMPAESVVELFKGFSDFSERLTRYQVEHIAGERGSRTRYTPPKCDTLRTHGVCINPDAICRRIRHPANYYKLKTQGKSRKPVEQE